MKIHRSKDTTEKKSKKYKVSMESGEKTAMDQQAIEITMILVCPSENATRNILHFFFLFSSKGRTRY